MRHYNHKLRDSIFLNMKESPIADSLSNFSAPFVAREIGPGLGQPLKWPFGFDPLSELVVSYAKDEDFWGEEDGEEDEDFWGEG
jgi:hypothetical protein